MSRYDGGSAFPINDTHYPNGQIQYGCVGMTLRDYFAAKAMQGYISAKTIRTQEQLVEYSYLFADAMLAERTK